MDKSPFTLTPEYRDYVWGGSKLRPGIVPTAEAWIIYAGNRIASGPYAGQLLADITGQFGIDLLGIKGIQIRGKEFPVLVKILDCAQWLSLQVHPNDEQAKQIEGEGLFGKTEAWHVLEAEPNAKLIAGMQPGISSEKLSEAIRNGSVLDYVQKVDAKTGDTFFIKPGTIHALGPGLLIYEIQQTSDITYRVYDWGRPETETRKLHIDKALTVSNPTAVTAPRSMLQMAEGELALLAQCEYFKLESVDLESKPISLDTGGESFHGLTVIEGQVQVSAGNEVFILNKFETLFIPAVCGAYQIKPLGKSRVLRAGV